MSVAAVMLKIRDLLTVIFLSRLVCARICGTATPQSSARAPVVSRRSSKAVIL